MNIERAKAIRRVITEAMQSVDDETALENPLLFPEWAPGVAYSAGFKVQHNGTLYKVLQNHTSQSDWTPVAAASLFAKILPGQEGTDIGEWIQPDSTNPYMKGDKVTYNGSTWVSDIDNNVWAPDVYGWTKE